MTDGDETDNVKDGCDPLTIGKDQAAKDYTCTATSADGGTNSVTVTIKWDAEGRWCPSRG